MCVLNRACEKGHWTYGLNVCSCAQVGARFCMAMYFTLKNLEWLVATKIMKGDGPALSKVCLGGHCFGAQFCSLLVEKGGGGCCTGKFCAHILREGTYT